MGITKLPDIYLFNPTCEYAVANGNASWQPNALLKKMEEDLGVLPLFFAGRDDLVLVKKMPSANFTDLLRDIGIKPPGFILTEDALKKNMLAEKLLGKLRPWGWSPAVHQLLSPLKEHCSDEFKKSPVSKWDPAMKELSSKKFGLEILKTILPSLPAEIMIDKSLLPEICYSRFEIENMLNRFGKIMIKAPWGSSGRGLQPVTKLPVADKVWEKIMGIIRQQGYLIAEPLLMKQLDMALQFELKNGRVLYLGVSRFLTDKKGQYKGNLLNGWPGTYDPEVTTFADDLIPVIRETLIKAIENSKLSTHYEGFFGVDTIIFRDKNGKLKANPCLEINVRQNMGLLSLYLNKLIFNGKKGIFKIYYSQGKSFYDFIKEMQSKYPINIENSRIRSGFMPLTDANDKTLFGACLLV
jgi:hypothetical protein